MRGQATPWAALFLCLVAGCLAERTGPSVSLAPVGDVVPWEGRWRGELPQSSVRADTVSSSSQNRTEATRQPQPETLLILAQRCYETAGDAARDNEQRYEHYQRALALYRQVLQQDPNNEAACLGQARIYKKQGQLDQAEAELQRLVARSPKLAAAWYELGMCYGARQNWAEQIRCLQRACQLEPENTRLAVHLGLALARAQRWQEAEQQLSRAVGPARAHYYLALMAEHLNREDLVRRYAHTAAQADPSFRDHPWFQQWLTNTQPAASESAQR